MIIGNIRDCEKYCAVNKSFKSAFELLKILMTDKEPGVKTLGCLRGSVVNAVTSDKDKDGKDKVFEAHRKFIDIHFIVDGEECIGYGNVNELIPVTEYDDGNDFLLLRGHISRVRLGAGDFCIAFPEDAHIPAMECNGSKPVKRAVVKIPL